MAEWCGFTPHWMRRAEKIAPNVWLHCWARPATYIRKDAFMPFGWVRAYPHDGSTGMWGDSLDEYKINSDGGMLELECAAHELRKKYQACT